MLFTYGRCWMYSRWFMSNEWLMCSIIKRIKWWKQWWIIWRKFRRIKRWKQRWIIRRKFWSKFKRNDNVFKWRASLWKWTSVVM